MFNVPKTNKVHDGLDNIEDHTTDLDLSGFGENYNPAITFQPQLGDGLDSGTRRPIPVSTVDWRTRSVSQFIPMHGLDFLGGVDQLHVQQTVELNDLLSNTESENRYIIKVPNGETLYYASESSTSFQRTCFGSARAFRMKIYDQTQQEALEIRRRLACGTCSFWCYLQVMEVVSKPTDFVGTIEQQFSPSIPLFFVYNQQRHLLYRIEGPSTCACLSFGKDAHFKIYTPDGATQVGSINHQWDQILVAYNLSIQFPGRSLDPKHKALLLGAGFLMLLPKFCYADFEKAMHSSALLAWPNLIIKAYRFHLGQSCWRKIQALGLGKDYRDNTEIGTFLKVFEVVRKRHR